MAVDIVAISGSLRRGSYNSGLLRAAKYLAPANLAIEILDISAIPLYNEDLEVGGATPEVHAFQLRAARASGLLLATPEYNHGTPGVLKNAIDWLSRPLSPQSASALGADAPKTALTGKAAAIMGASPGLGGTIRAQIQLRQSLNALVDLMPKPDVFVTQAKAKFDDAGNLTDQPTKEFLESFLKSFEAYLKRLRHLA